jgi:hypothetical protein
MGEVNKDYPSLAMPAITTSVLAAMEAAEKAQIAAINTYYTTGIDMPSGVPNQLYGKRTSTVVLRSADVVNSANNILADVTGLQFWVENGQSYYFKFYIMYTSAATTTGSRWTINGPATSALNYTSIYTLTSSTVTTNSNQTAYNLPAAANATSELTGNIATIEGTLTASASGYVVARFASEVNTSAITAKVGSWVQVTQTLA